MTTSIMVCETRQDAGNMLQPARAIKTTRASHTLTMPVYLNMPIKSTLGVHKL